MDLFSLTPVAANIFLPEQRKTYRNPGRHLLVITGKGTGKVLDISCYGLAFGCLYPHTFPTQWHIDILGAEGTFIKNLKVNKRWEQNHCCNDDLQNYELTVGVEFIDLTKSQASQLSELTSSLEI